MEKRIYKLIKIKLRNYYDRIYTKIHSRIGEIQNTFNKLGFAPLNTQLPIKPFSEYLNEAMANSSKNKINNSDGSLSIENNIKNNKIDNGKL